MWYWAVSRVRKVGGRSGSAKPAGPAASGQNSSTMRRARPPAVWIDGSPPARSRERRSAVL